MKEVPVELIKLLSDGDYHSGEIVGQALGVSRAAVWKKLKSLESFGIDVESVKGKGYRLIQPVTLFSAEGLDAISERYDLPSVMLSNVIDSTNTQLMSYIQGGGSCHKQILLAEQQTSGRGRRGKHWVSPYASNLYFSMGWNFEQGATSLDGLSLVVGLALQKSIQTFSSISAKVKWPNDLLVDGGKLAGILLEITGDPTGLCHVVIGVGVNLNMGDSKGEIDQPWRSLSKLTGSIINKTEFVDCFVRQLLEYLQLFSKSGFSAFTEHWAHADALVGHNLMLTQGQNVVFGECCGVNEKGELLLKTSLGVESYNGGEVSVRKRALA